MLSRMVSMLSDSSALRFSKIKPQCDTGRKSFFGKLVLSDFDQSNLRREYDGKC